MYVDVHVQPGSQRPGVLGLHGDAVKINMAARPTEGKANEAVIAMVAELFGVPARRVVVVSGYRSRRKRLFIEGLAITHAQDVLSALSG